MHFRSVLNAIVKKTKNVDELLTKEEFEVVTSSGIAFEIGRESFRERVYVQV